MEREISVIIVLVTFIEKDSFSVIWKMFDICSFEVLVVVILIGMILLNEMRTYCFLIDYTVF